MLIPSCDRRECSSMPGSATPRAGDDLRTGIGQLLPVPVSKLLLDYEPGPGQEVGQRVRIKEPQCAPTDQRPLPAWTTEGTSEATFPTTGDSTRCAIRTTLPACSISTAFSGVQASHPRAGGLRVSNTKRPLSVRADRMAASDASSCSSSTNTWNACPVMTIRSNSRRQSTEARSPWTQSISRRFRACSSIASAGSSPHSRAV